MKKRRIKTLIVISTILVLGGFVAWRWEFLLRAYILHEVCSVTIALPHCDRVEIYHLNGNAFGSEADGLKKGEGFPTRAYGDAEAKILGLSTLTGQEAEALAASWRAQRFDWTLQKLCHSPVCGLRFYSGRKLLFETSICFHCSNFYVTDRFLDSGRWGFDADTPNAKHFGQCLQSLFPATSGQK